MSRRRDDLLGTVFWIAFVPYVLGVAVWLLVGLLPSLAHEVGSLHTELHDEGRDALRTSGRVTLVLQNHGDTPHGLVVLDPRGERLRDVRIPAVAPHGSDSVEFEPPSPGEYEIRSTADPEVGGELRIADDGRRSLTFRINEGEDRVVVVGIGDWAGFVGRIADASHHASHGGRVALEALFTVLNLGLGVLLVVRRPRDTTARLLAVGMVGTAATFNHQSHVVLHEFLLGDWWTPHLLFHLGSGLAYLFAVVVFPDGRLLPFTRTAPQRMAVRAAYGAAAVVLAGFVYISTADSHPGQTFFTVLFGVTIPVVGVAAQTYRLRHVSDPERRQQSRLLRWALLPMLTFGALYLLTTVVGGTEATESGSWVSDLGLSVFPALFALVPLALVMGILRYRLWEIDVLVSKTLLSVGLVAFIGAVYVGVVVVLGRALGPGDSAVIKIVATAIAAVAFEPVRERLERLANRLVYGRRATPYEVMAAFADRLSGVISVDEVLPRTAEAVALGVGAAAVRVTTFHHGGGTRTVRWPPDDETRSFTKVVVVLHRGVPVGEIAVAKPPGEKLTATEHRLLRSLVAQAGVAFNNAGLTVELEDRLQQMTEQTADLRASRQRIVTARQGERQRFVGLIHEQVETHLEQVDAGLEHVQTLLPARGEEALAQFDGLLGEGQAGLDALRDLARGIFPPVLADQGVLPALQAYLLQAQLPVDVELRGEQDRYEASAEASTYFCVVQALNNTGTYAAGSTVTVTLEFDDDRLEFSVTDDGPGVDDRRLTAGADIQNMRDRVEAVGGHFDAVSVIGRGTAVAGWVPVSPPVDARTTVATAEHR
jgi:signal transduction histidine kinase